MNWADIANVTTTLGLAAVTVGLVMTAKQIRDADKTARAQFLNELESDAQRFQQVFEHLIPLGQPVTEEQRVAFGKDVLLFFSCLNFFEKVQLLIDNGSVQLRSVDRLFAGRFFLVVHSPLVQSSVLLNQSYVQYFAGVASLYQMWFQFRKEEGRPILLEENAIHEFL